MALRPNHQPFFPFFCTDLFASLSIRLHLRALSLFFSPTGRSWPGRSYGSIPFSFVERGRCLASGRWNRGTSRTGDAATTNDDLIKDESVGGLRRPITRFARTTKIDATTRFAIVFIPCHHSRRFARFLGDISVGKSPLLPTTFACFVSLLRRIT